MSKLVTYFGKKFVGDRVAEQIAAEDPYYQYVEVEATGKDKEQGKKAYKKIKRQLPVGISKHDEKILKKVRRRAWFLDLLFSLCGIRVGWTAIIGLVPVVGDIINTFLGYRVIRLAEQVDGGLPAGLRSHMVINVVIDCGLQLVPIVGDIAGAVYKSNSRNYMLLEEHLRKRAAKHPNPDAAGGGVMVGGKHYPAPPAHNRANPPPPPQNQPVSTAVPNNAQYGAQQSGVY